MASLLPAPLLLLAFTLHPPPHTATLRTFEFPSSLPPETGFRRIHFPQRVLTVVGGLALVPNSTLPPVRSGAPAVVVMGFEVQTIAGRRWSARLISSRRDECDLFLMDSETLQRTAAAKLRVTPRSDGGEGHSIATRLTLFEEAHRHLLLPPGWWWCGSTGTATLHRSERGLHRLFLRMVLSPSISS